MLKSDMKADLIIKDVKVIDVFQNEIYKGNVAVKNGKIIGIGDYEDADEIVDAKGSYLSPTMTDGHVHIESSMVSPAEFLKCLVARGVSTIIADPHEIANVCGLDGLEYIIDETKDLPAHVYVMLPSCVPCTPFETSGAILKACDYKEMINNPRVLGLGEMMDFVGTVNRSEDILEKIDLAKNSNKVVDGHAPLLSAKALDDYVLAGISTDHECSAVDEMKEKIRRGMYIQLREGTAAKNLEALIKGVTKDNISRCFFCTDDRHPQDLLKDGNVDNNVRKAIKLGMEPLDAIKMATLNPAQCYKMENSGAIAPGYVADFFLFDDLNNINAKAVFIGGKKVAEDGKVIVDFPQKLSPKVLSKMNIRDFKLEDLKLRLNSNRVHVIEMEKESLLTKKIICYVDVKDGYFEYSDDGIRKIVVIERHTGNSAIAIGLIKGYDIKNAAVGTTIAHDSHNLVVIGDNDEDMLNVIKKIDEMSGGMAISSNGKLEGSLRLDIAGIMSSKSMTEVHEDIKKLLEKAKELGVGDGIDPFMTLGFMALPVIPDIKMTDKGLFDVNEFKHIPLEV